MPFVMVGHLNGSIKLFFSDMIEEEVDKLTPKAITEMELAVMEHNAFEICEEVKNRCNEAHALGGFLKAFVSKSLEDSQYLEAYISRKKADIVPGFYYYQELENFMRLHFIKGEKFVEFVKCACLEKQQEVCDFCMNNDWIGQSVTVSQLLCLTHPHPHTDIFMSGILH